jgi:hypothetical protein
MPHDGACRREAHGREGRVKRRHGRQHADAVVARARGGDGGDGRRNRRRGYPADQTRCRRL